MCVCNSHRQVPSNKARSVLPQVQRQRRGEEEEGKEKEDKEEGKEGGREDEGEACSPLIPSNIPLDDRAGPKER